MNIQEKASNQIITLKRFLLATTFIILCSFTILAYAGGDYEGTPYFSSPMSIANRVQHEYHDKGDKGVAYYELTTVAGSPQSDSRAEKMAPTEWAKYTLYIPKHLRGGDYYVQVRASTPCKKSNKSGNLEFTTDEGQALDLAVNTNGRYNKQNILSDGTIGFTDEIVVVKVKSSGNCGVYLDRFEFVSPTGTPD